MIKKENYVQISGWMISELNLSGNELIAYALIHGFSQDGKSVFRGSLSYMQEWLNCGSRQTVIKTVKNLVEKRLIEKRILHRNNETIGCEYWTVFSRSKEYQTTQGGSPKNRLPPVENAQTEKTPSLKNGLPPVQKLDHPSPEFRPGGSPNSGHNILNSNSNDTATALKNASDKILGKNFFDQEFPKKAEEFLRAQNISETEAYFEFIKDKCAAKNASSPRGFMYKIFFQTDVAEEFRKKQQRIICEREEAEKTKAEEERQKIECPVCGERFSAKRSESCPKCEFLLSDFGKAEKIKRHKKYMSLPECRRKKYDEEFMRFKSEIPVYKRLVYFNTPQGKDEQRKFIAALDRKYGLDESG